jgi:hypothetical protein
MLPDSGDTMRSEYSVKCPQHDLSEVLIGLELHHPHALLDLRIKKPADVNTARYLFRHDEPPAPKLCRVRARSESR